MKSRNISFAEVLKNRTKSPRIESQGNLSLSEIIQQFQKYPQIDYTLRLGNNRTVQKNNQSNKMLFSRTTIQSQADIFDSWIQRQSMVGNKENIINQPQGKTKTQLPNLPQESLKYNLGFRAKQPPKMPTSMMASLRRRNVTKNQLQPQFEPHNFENIQNYSTQQDAKKFIYSNSSINLCQKSKELCFLDEKGDKNLHLTKLNNQKMSKNSKQRDNLRNQFNKITEKKIQQITNLFNKEQKDLPSNQHLHKLINSTQNIHTEIATLAKKYLDQKNQRPADEQQEILLEDSRAQERKLDYCLGKNGHEQFQNNDEIQKKRWQDAKCMVNGFFNKFNKPKSTNKITSEQQRFQKQIIIQSIASKDCGQNGGNHLFVGYSFALNQVMPSTKYQFPQNQLIIDQISEIESQLTSQRISDSDYFDFKSKYLHPEPVRAGNDNIMNIQSVQFQPFRKQHQIVSNIPNAFDFQQIRQPQKQENKTQLIKQNSTFLYRKQPKLQFDSKIEETVFKETLKFQTNELKPQKKEYHSTKITHHAKSSSQKISIVSSSKCKMSQERSNKTSPQTNQLIQKQAQVMTTIFNLSPPIVETKVQIQSINQQNQILKRQQKTKFSTAKDIHNNSKQLVGYPSKKTIKDVKKSIISPVEYPLGPSTNSGTVSSPTQEITFLYDSSYLIFPHNASNSNKAASTRSQLQLATLTGINKCSPFTANPIKTTMNKFSSCLNQEGASNLCSYENLNSQISSPHYQGYIRYKQYNEIKQQNSIINGYKQSQDSNMHLLNKQSPLTFQQPLLNQNNPSICIQKQPKQQISCLESSDFIFDI